LDLGAHFSTKKDHDISNLLNALQFLLRTGDYECLKMKNIICRLPLSNRSNEGFFSCYCKNARLHVEELWLTKSAYTICSDLADLVLITIRVIGDHKNMSDPPS